MNEDDFTLVRKALKQIPREILREPFPKNPAIDEMQAVRSWWQVSSEDALARIESQLRSLTEENERLRAGWQKSEHEREVLNAQLGNEEALTVEAEQRAARAMRALEVVKAYFEAQPPQDGAGIGAVSVVLHALSPIDSPLGQGVDE